MKTIVMEEPQIEFANGQRDVDIRSGITQFGVSDLGASVVPNPLRIGVVGTPGTINALRKWTTTHVGGAESSEMKLRELRPDFPGMSVERYGTTIDPEAFKVREIPAAELQRTMTSTRSHTAAVELFVEHTNDLAQRGGVDVVVIAPPPEVLALGSNEAHATSDALDDAQDDEGLPLGTLDFHDAFKARALSLPVPTQMIRPDTIGFSSVGVKLRRRTLNIAAIRAWNFFTALYYKAGGVPWRLAREQQRLGTCYMGASFFKTVDGDRLVTSVAQVFDERGEGMVVQGANARLDKEDRTPHLSAEDAEKLVSAGIKAYRREHKTTPARLVVHKTSSFNEAELAGARAAAASEKIDILDLVWVRRSGTRLLRGGPAAVLRGTVLLFDDSSGVVHLKGTVPHFKMYPGSYIPRPIEFKVDGGETPATDIASELLALSKLNFNNTQFDSGDPVTIGAARRVGEILKHTKSDRLVEQRFRWFT